MNFGHSYRPYRRNLSGPSFGRSVVFAFDFDRHALIARLHSGMAHILLAGSSNAGDRRLWHKAECNRLTPEL